MRKFILLISFCVALSISTTFLPARFDGEKVIRVYADNINEMKLLQETIGEEADIWSRESTLGIGANDIRVDASLESKIKSLGLKVESFIDDLQALIDQESADIQAYRNRDVNARDNLQWFTSYHTYDEIVSYMEQLAADYPAICTFNASIGHSIEGRSIPSLTITGSTKANRQRLWFNGGQHAREWVGPATVLFLATQLVENYGSQTLVTDLINTVEFDIVPMVNPDGYVYSWNTYRLWRKNRRNNGGGVYGVDLNRNWNDHWGGSGSSGTPSSDTYRGKSPFSEPESMFVSNYINSLPNIIGAIDFHSYSQLILRPYGWTNANCPDETALKIIGEGVRYTISEVYGVDYENIKSIALYITDGTASDWFYQEGIWAAYTIELRDTGRYGFVLPANQIIPNGEEIWNSMLYFWETVIADYPY